jgi:mono/diheme cytochrome c family protein
MADGMLTEQVVRPTLFAAALLFSGVLQAEAVSFENDVQPILTKHCVVCHLPGDEQGDHSLYPDAWKNTVNVPSVQSELLLVAPGKPDASYFYLKLTGEHLAAGGSGEIMPFPHGPLDPAEIDAVRGWIEQGALRN